MPWLAATTRPARASTKSRRKRERPNASVQSGTRRRATPAINDSGEDARAPWADAPSAKNSMDSGYAGPK